MSCSLKDLPEFYVLVQAENRELEEVSVAGSSTAYLSQTEKLKLLRKKIASQSKVPKKTVTDEFYDSLRRANRPIYSRGHEVHSPGAELPFRPYGESPIASHGVQSSPGRGSVLNSGIGAVISRPATGNSFQSTRKPGNRDSLTSNYSRPASPSHVISGQVKAPLFKSHSFNSPLTNISYIAPSTQLCNPTSSGYYPSDAENLLEDTRFISIGGFAQKVSVRICNVCVEFNDNFLYILFAFIFIGDIWENFLGGQEISN
jgi:hypothetical protein